MPTIKVLRTGLEFTGPGLGFTLPTNIDARYKFEAALSKIPAALRRFFFDPEHVTLETSGGIETVAALRNILSNQDFVEGGAAVLRNAAAAASRRPVKAVFAGGAESLSMPQSGTTVEPFVCPYAIPAGAHTYFGVSRITNGSNADILGTIGASLDGVGVHLRKEASTHNLTWFFEGATGFLRAAGSWLNKTMFWVLCYDATVGRKLYINGVLVASDLTATGKKAPTVTGMQLFSSNSTGANSASGMHGFMGGVAVDLSAPAYADVWSAMHDYAAATYPLGS